MQHQPLHVPYLLVLPSAAHPGCLPKQEEGVRFTRDCVKTTLCCMGVKNRHAFKIAQQVFLRAAAHLPELAKPQHRRSSALANWSALPHGTASSGEVCICLPRAEFYELLCSCLAEHNYKCTPSSEDLRVACSLRERRKCVVVLICGTSGSGKSTLASILANRLGITTVISTDSVRHMLRSFTTKEQAPLLYASTYQAGESLPLANHKEATHAQITSQRSSNAPQQQIVGGSDLERAILGYKAQCEPVVHKLDVLISDFEARKQSLVIEGVHLSISLVVKLMQRHPSVIPFLVYIKSEAKHMERMSVRAKYMTLDPQKNRYVAHMHCIRWIQDYLVRKADHHLIPKVENSNVDQSVGLIHVALTGMLKRTLRGEPVLDPKTNTARFLHAELRAAAKSLSTTSKAMVKQVRLAESAHTAYASAPLPSWPSDGETVQGSDTASQQAAHSRMRSSATAEGPAQGVTAAAGQPQPQSHAAPPVLDVSLGSTNGSTECTLKLGVFLPAPVSAPRPSALA